MDDLRDYQLSFDPANETASEADAIRRYLLGFSGEYDLHAE